MPLSGFRRRPVSPIILRSFHAMPDVSLQLRHYERRPSSAIVHRRYAGRIYFERRRCFAGSRGLRGTDIAMLSAAFAQRVLLQSEAEPALLINGRRSDVQTAVDRSGTSAWRRTWLRCDRRLRQFVHQLHPAVRRRISAAGVAARRCAGDQAPARRLLPARGRREQIRRLDREDPHQGRARAASSRARKSRSKTLTRLPAFPD